MEGETDACHCTWRFEGCTATTSVKLGLLPGASAASPRPFIALTTPLMHQLSGRWGSLLCRRHCPPPSSTAARSHPHLALSGNPRTADLPPHVSPPCSLTCRPQAGRRQHARRGAAVQPQAAFAQIGHTDTSHMSSAGSSSSSSQREAKRLPIAYSPEWMALREHTKEVESL